MSVVGIHAISGYTPPVVPVRASSSRPSGQATEEEWNKKLNRLIRMVTYIHDASQHEVGGGGDITFNFQNLLSRNNRRFFWGFIAAQSVRVRSANDASCKSVSVLSVHFAHKILIDKTRSISHSSATCNISSVVQSRYVSESIQDCRITFFGI